MRLRVAVLVGCTALPVGCWPSVIADGVYHAVSPGRQDSSAWTLVLIALLLLMPSAFGLHRLWRRIGRDEMFLGLGRVAWRILLAAGLGLGLFAGIEFATARVRWTQAITRSRSAASHAPASCVSGAGQHQ